MHEEIFPVTPLPLLDMDPNSQTSTQESLTVRKYHQEVSKPEIQRKKNVD